MGMRAIGPKQDGDAGDVVSFISWPATTWHQKEEDSHQQQSGKKKE